MATLGWLIGSLYIYIYIERIIYNFIHIYINRYILIYIYIYRRLGGGGYGCVSLAAFAWFWICVYIYILRCTRAYPCSAYPCRGIQSSWQRLCSSVLFLVGLGWSRCACVVLCGFLLVCACLAAFVWFCVVVI